MPEIILTRIQRCHNCGREVTRAPLEYQQNPFCTVCLKDRVKKVSPRGGVRWRSAGHYVIAEASQKLPSGVRKRRRG
jgi:hypothetical protein